MATYRFGKWISWDHYDYFSIEKKGFWGWSEVKRWGLGFNYFDQSYSDSFEKRIWLALDRISHKVAAWTIGDRSEATFRPLYDTLVSNGTERFCTDNYNVYHAVITKSHGLGKELTTHVESFWSDARLFIKGLNRRTKACFKSFETLCVFFKFYVYNYNLKLS